MEQILAALEELDGHGGASQSLLAWELCVDETEVAPAFGEAKERGLCEPGGEQHGEQYWRLTDKGRAAVSSGERAGEAGLSA